MKHAFNWIAQEDYVDAVGWYYWKKNNERTPLKNLIFSDNKDQGRNEPQFVIVLLYFINACNKLTFLQFKQSSYLLSFIILSYSFFFFVHRGRLRTVYYI